MYSEGCQLYCQVLGNGQSTLEHVQLDLEEELVAGDLLDQTAGVSGVELYAQIKGDRGNATDLPGHPLVGIQPVLEYGEQNEQLINYLK